MLINVQIKHGSNKQNLALDDQSLITDLMDEVETLTGVPMGAQKLILNGKALTSLDTSRTLKSVRVTNNCKIMVLGKRWDPASDEMYGKVLEIERQSSEVDKRLAEVATEVADLERGYLASDLHEKALKALSRRAKSGTEEYMRLLLSLDSFSFNEDQGEARQKRKNVVNAVNAKMDRNDTFIGKIDTLLKQTK